MNKYNRSTILSLIVVSAMIFVGNVVRGGFGIVQEAAKYDLSLSDHAISLVQGLALSVPTALLAVPFGRAVDRVNRLALMWLMGVLWSLGAILTAFANSFELLFLARMAAGLGTTCGIPAAISLVADLSPPAQRGRAILMLTVGQWGGVAAAFAIGGALSGWFVEYGGVGGLAPWRSVNLVMGITSAFLLLTMLAIREPVRQEEGAGVGAPIFETARELWNWRRFLIPLFVGQVGAVMADSAATIWVASVLTRSYNLQPEQFGGWIGIVLFASGIGGAVVGGIAADAGHRSGRRGGILIAAVLAAAVAVPASLFPLMPTASGFGILLALLLAAGPVMGVVTTTAVAVILPNEVRGLCTGVFMAIAGVFGFGVAPVLVTWLADLLGGESQLSTSLAVTNFSIGLVSLAAFWIAMRRVPASQSSKGASGEA